MRPLLNILIILLSIPVHAYNCPSYLLEREDSQVALEWLKNFEGKHELGDCQIEIVTCEKKSDFNDAAPIAEILVIDGLGREAYLSVDFPKKNSRIFRTKVKSHRRMLNLKKKDRHYEHINGRTEVWRLEMRTDWDDTSKLNAFELGVYSTNNQLNQWNGNDSHWFTCYHEQP